MGDELADALEGEPIFELVFVDQADRHPVGGSVSRRSLALGRDVFVDGLTQRLLERRKKRLARQLHDSQRLRQREALARDGRAQQRLEGAFRRVDGRGRRLANGLLRRRERRLDM